MSLDPERDARNREALRKFDLDAVICCAPSNVLLLTGHWPLSCNAFVVYPREGPVSLIAYETEAWAVRDGVVDGVLTFPAGRLGAPDVYDSVERLLCEVARKGRVTGRIGVELDFDAISAGHQSAEMPIPGAASRRAIERALPGSQLVDVAQAVIWSRKVKTRAEIECLRRANRIASFGLDAFRSICEPGRTEMDVSAAAESAVMRGGMRVEGVRDVRAWAQTMSGAGSSAAWVMHPWSTNRRIERGDLVVLELGTVVDGYWSDLTRTLVAGGAPSAQVAEMYEAVVAAHDAVISDARPAMSEDEVDGLARSEIERRGFGRLFQHATGHALGFQYHETEIVLAPGRAGRLEPGIVTSVEPGLYLEGLGGMRLEDNVVFGDAGVQPISEAAFSLAG
jgi:Xaa-Pro aminopeptidase